MLNYDKEREPAGGFLPYHLRGGMRRWIEDGIQPGSFLTAVLEGELFEAVIHADEQASAALAEIVRWCYEELPASFGRPNSMKVWREVWRSAIEEMIVALHVQPCANVYDGCHYVVPYRADDGRCDCCTPCVEREQEAFDRAEQGIQDAEAERG